MRRWSSLMHTAKRLSLWSTFWEFWARSWNDSLLRWRALTNWLGMCVPLACLPARMARQHCSGWPIRWRTTVAGSSQHAEQDLLGTLQKRLAFATTRHLCLENTRLASVFLSIKLFSLRHVLAASTLQSLYPSSTPTSTPTSTSFCTIPLPVQTRASRSCSAPPKSHARLTKSLWWTAQLKPNGSSSLHGKYCHVLNECYIDK